MSAQSNTFKKTIRDECLGKLGLCDCGTGSEYDVVLFLLERSEKALEKGLPGFYDPAPDAAAPWVEFGAKVLDAAGLLEHGTGIGCAWLTDEGKALLSFLREFGTDRHKWPAWAVAVNAGPEDTLVEIEGNEPLCQ
jgi:hypothetical protein